MGDDIGKLGRLARVGEGDHGIARRNHAQVAVAGFAGMDKDRRRAGGGQRRRDLVGDMPALAHARRHHATRYAVDEIERLDEAGIEPCGQFTNAVGFDL